ncbi:MAG: hypothetical protein K1X64_14030 [Myxococcaceae bacterium]|nr:hypothetical protein [Myxococcaceae bacterium]
MFQRIFFASMTATLLAACGAAPQPTGPKLNPPPNCTAPATPITAEVLYNDVLKTSCAGSTCHGGGSMVPFKAGSAAEFKAVWVDQASTQTKQMPRVTPGDADKSYVMYKVMGQGTLAGGTASQMPLGSAALSNEALCKIYNWIESGAN